MSLDEFKSIVEGCLKASANINHVVIEFTEKDDDPERVEVKETKEGVQLHVVFNYDPRNLNSILENFGFHCEHEHARFWIR